MARCQGEMGKPEKAQETVEKALDLYPEAPSSLITRAAVRSGSDDYRGAEEDLRRVLEILPGSAEALGALGHNLMLTGRIDEAVECFERAANLNPTALASLVEARHFPEDEEVIQRMSQFAENPIVPHVTRIDRERKRGSEEERENLMNGIGTEKSDELTRGAHKKN